MADFSTLIATLQATIKTNYNQEITGQILQGDLLAMVNTINQLKQDTLEGYGFYGAPLADGASVNVTQNTFFLVGPGTYTINGEANTIAGAGISVLVYDSVNDEVRVYSLFSYDTTPTAASKNAITSGAVHTALADKQDKDADAVAGNVAVMNASGDSEDGGVALTDLATKAEVAVLAGEAGLVEAVIDTDGAGTEQEFTFRKSGGDGGAYYRKIKGKTLAWNQLAELHHAASFSMNNCTITRDGYGKTTIIVGSGGASGNVTETICSINPIWIIGHKYLCKVSANFTPSSSTIRIGNNFYIWWDSLGYIWTCEGVNGGFAFQVVSGCPAGTYILDKPIIFDLTLMFGVGNEPSTVAEFEALYPDIYPYNPGTLISNDAEAVETTGVNQWDESNRVNGYYINWNTGAESSDPSSSHTGYVPVLSNTDYYFKHGGTNGQWGAFYDSNKNYISGLNNFGLNGGSMFHTPEGCAFVRITIDASSASSTVCINLSNPAINGQYFPYWKRTLQLGITTRKDTDGNVPFPNGLQSCPVAQDEATKEGGTIRVGARAYQAGDESDANVITDGTNTNYALATPVPFTWEEPLNLGVKVDENGTERAVAPEGATAPSAPFVADTTYTMSVARMVEKLQNI